MVRVYLLLALTGLLFGPMLMRNSKISLTASLQFLKKKQSVILLGLALLVLAITGKLNGLIAGMGLVALVFLRLLPALARFAEHQQQLWNLYAERVRQQLANTNMNMDKSQALDILGLTEGATEADVVDAHRKLVSKLHPDRGGSAYLTAQINLARKLLLNK